MSDIDTTSNLSDPQVPAAPPPGSDTQGSAPASVDTTATGQDEPKGEQPDKQSRRESRAFAAQRRENRELHRTLGRMEAEMESLRGTRQGDPPATEQQPPRQERSPAQLAADRDDADHSRTVIERIEDGGEEIEGFDKVLDTIQDPKFTINRVMRDFLGETDKPAEMAKWLTDNPGEARRISRLSDAVAVRALERVEAKLPAKPAPRVTKAPAPVSTVGGSSRAAIDPRTGPSGSMDDYAKWRRSGA